MKLSNIQAGDKVIGVRWDREYYPMIVTKLTPTRFMTDEGMTFLIKSGQRWGREQDYSYSGKAGVTKAEPFTEELYQKALDQESARRLKQERERLVNKLYSRLQDVRKHHICQHSNKRLELVLEVLEDLINPQTTGEITNFDVEHIELPPTIEDISQKNLYEDSFTG
jgi:hypothetical protein